MKRGRLLPTGLYRRLKYAKRAFEPLLDVPVRVRKRVRKAAWWKQFVNRMAHRAQRWLQPYGWEVLPSRDLQRLRRAFEYEFYWYNAWKKLDPRKVQGFSTLAEQAIREHRTGMRYDRLYTLWQTMGAIRSDLPIAEVGAYRGGSARFIAETLRFHGRSNHFYVCDTFRGHVTVDETLDGPHQVGVQFTDTSLGDVALHLKSFSNVQLVEGDFRETSRTLEREASFAGVHLDVDVYSVMQHCLRFFAPRLAPGAVIVVDDYGFTTCRGAKQAVDEFAAAEPTFRVVHLLTGQAVLWRTG